jgi:hypothetical protein
MRGGASNASRNGAISPITAVPRLSPPDLREHVRDAILRFIDIETWNHCAMVAEAEQESLESFVRAWPQGRSILRQDPE